MKLSFSALVFGLGLVSLSACSDGKDEIQQKLDLERARTQELETAKDEAGAKVQKLEATTRELSENLTRNGQALSEAQRGLDTANRSLAEKSAQIDQLSRAIEAKNRLVIELDADLSRKDGRVAEIEAEIARNKNTIEELKKTIETSSDGRTRELATQLAAKAEENQRLQAELTGLQAEKAKTSAQLASSEAALSDLKSAHAALAANVEAKAYSGVMALLENTGPESLFGVTDWVLRDTYKLEDGQECLMIFNIDREIESVARNRAVTVPSIGGFQMVPLRIAYQKVAVCQKEGVTQAQRESGFIYKGIPSDNAERRVLISTRTESSCDKLEASVQKQNVFSGQYQLFYPYAGQIDGIETVNLLRPSNQVLEYNMGSAHPSILASSCQDLLKDSGASALASTACRLARGDKAADLNVSLGCFAEKQSGNQTSLTFNK